MLSRQMAVVGGIEPPISEATTRRINHSPIQPNLNFDNEISNSYLAPSVRVELTINALEERCLIHLATRVYLSGEYENRTRLMFCLQDRCPPHADPLPISI